MPKVDAPSTRGNPVRKKPALGRGRQTILTEEVQKKICDAVRAGVYLSTAARYAGVGVSTLMLWMKKGREATTRNARTQIYIDFVEAVEEAEAQSEVAAQLQWRAAWSKDWHSAEKWLQSRYPDRYGPNRDPNGPTAAFAGVNVTINAPTGPNGAQISPETANLPLEALIEANPRLLNAAQGLFDELDAMYGGKTDDQPTNEPVARLRAPETVKTDEFGVIEGTFTPISDENDD